MPIGCQVSGIIYTGENEVAANVSLRFTPLSITGAAVSVVTIHARTNAAGEIVDSDGHPYIELVQGGTYKLKGAILGGYDDATGENIQIPATATANFSDLISVAAIPSEGLTVRDNNVIHGNLIGDIDFVGFTVTYPSAGRVRITDVGGGLSDGDKGDITVSASGATWTIDNGVIDNARVNAGAAIAYSKLNLTSSIVAADIADAELAALAGLTSAANKLPYFTGVGTASLADFSAFGRSLVDDADASAAQTTLGLVIGTNVQAFNADLAAIAALTPSNDDLLQRKAGAWTNRTPAQYKTDLALVKADVGLGNVLNSVQLVAASNLSDLANAGTARTNLGVAIGSDVQAFNANLTTFAGIAPSANVQTLLGAADYAAFRTSLGLVIGTNVQAFNANLAAIAGLADPNADRLLFWDDSAGQFTHLTLGTNLSITGTTLDAAGGSGVALGDSPTWTGQHIHSISNAAAWAIGPNGNTNPVLRIVTDVASQATGLSITGRAAAAGVEIAVLGGGTNENLNIVPKGFGYVGIQATGNYSILNFGNSTSANCAQIYSVGNEFVISQQRNAAITFQTNNNDRWNISAAGHFLTNTDSAYTIGGATGNRPIKVNVAQTDADTNTILNALQLGRNSSGTPAAGLGTGILFQMESSTTADQDAAQIAAVLSTATHASLSSYLQLSVREGGAALAAVAKFDKSATAGDTGLWLWSADLGAVVRVLVGAADSAGSGFRALRIAN